MLNFRIVLVVLEIIIVNKENFKNFLILWEFKLIYFINSIYFSNIIFFLGREIFEVR